MSDMPKFEFPTDMRAFAEKSMDQAREAFETFMSNVQQSLNTVEGHAAKNRAGAKDVAEMSMRFAEDNIAKSFAFAQRLVRAKDAQEAMQLQADYIKGQMQTLSDQAKELTAAAAKAGVPMPKI